MQREAQLAKISENIAGGESEPNHKTSNWLAGGKKFNLERSLQVQSYLPTSLPEHPEPRLPPLHHRELTRDLRSLCALARDADEDDWVQRPQRVAHVRVPVPRRRVVVRDDDGLLLLLTSDWKLTSDFVAENALQTARVSACETSLPTNGVGVADTACLHGPAVDHDRMPLWRELRGKHVLGIPLVSVLRYKFWIAVIADVHVRHSRRWDFRVELLGDCGLAVSQTITRAGCVLHPRRLSLIG